MQMTYFWEVWEDVEGDARESRETAVERSLAGETRFSPHPV